MENNYTYSTMLLSFMLNLSFAQTGTIRGTVSDSTGKGIAITAVGLSSLPNQVTTNANGEYTITNINPGNYELVAIAMGYATYRQQVTISDTYDLTINIILKEVFHTIQEVEITGRKEASYKNNYSFSATKTETPLKDIAQSISSVTKELIQDRQALRLKDIIQNVAGMNEFSSYDDITMRGFRNSGSNGRLLNGMRTYNTFWTSPLLVTIERVEFIKGPASAVFSNTNPGGTVNMVTKKPLNETRQSINFTIGSYNTFRSMADFTGPLREDKTLLYRLNLGYENADTFRDNVFNKAMVVAPSISFLPKEGTRFNADLIYTSLHTTLDRGRTIIQGNKNIFSTPLNLNISQPGDFLKQQNVSLTFSFSQRLASNLSFNTSYMKIKHDERLNEHVIAAYITPDSIRMGFTDRIVRYDGNNLTAYITYKINTGPLEQTFVAGYDYIDGYNIGYNRLARNAGSGVGNLSLKKLTHNIQPVATYVYDPTTIYSYGIKYNTQGFYLQDQIKYNRFQLLLSIRQEFYNYPKTEFSLMANNIPSTQQQKALLPRVGLTYTVTKNINVYSVYTTGFEPQAGGTLANPKAGGPFDPLTSELMEIGSKGELFNKRLFAGIAVYQITQNHVLVSARDTAKPELLEQRGQEQARGFELEACGKITANFSISINYAFNEAKITRDTEGDAKKLVGLIKENAPKHVTGSWIKYTIQTGALNGLGLGFGHSQVSIRETFDRTLKVPSYLIFHTAIYYQVQRFQLALNLNNLTNKKYMVGGNDYARTFPGAPRNFLINVGYTL